MIIRRKPKVLIVDDDSPTRSLTKMLIASLKWDLIGEADDYEKGLIIFNENKPELVLLNMIIQDKNGVDVLKKIKETSQNTCVIILSSITDINIVKKVISMGANNYIIKGLPIPDLKKSIEKTWNDFLIKKGIIKNYIS